MKKIVLLIPLVLIFIACNTNKDSIKIVSLNEVYQTVRNENDNVDSPCFWSGKEGEYWVISTAKSTHQLIIDDAVTGNNIKRFGKEGNSLGSFLRPNGIYAIDDFLFVVERDNHRVQVLTLPNLKPIGTFGDTLLIKPYGIYISKNVTTYSAFVTDNYQFENEKIPADSLLGKRVLQFTLMLNPEVVSSIFERYIGDTTGNGVLRIVESICGDPKNNHLLIAEEDTTNSSVKVYDMSGNFNGLVFGNNIFKGQVEGISLFTSENNGGFWIITDQSYQQNFFHLFERTTFKYIGAFKGNKTRNTDGIWLTKKKFGNFNQGVFFAVNNDGNISAFDLEEILNYFLK